ncbi:hypothetical protein CTT31_19310 [Pseudoalteromonas maricaloris]|uniref:hypothetical protein n=1 Tax=Pseudoalteromonas maricaloris TaxID=184924 RepID=UPI0021AD9970|nr:hypothetical protein [Pseudoalteromonas flavipulchra]USE71244.1 hypothetical protein CTT31_19310 [Pseudoalteromonas flavipulchra]
MVSINQFLESMDHEFSEYSDISIRRNGFKVDGERGIKVYLKMNELKSVDYFHDGNECGMEFIEFSDLYRQKNGLDESKKHLKHSNLDKPTKAKMLKKLHKEINIEMVNKYKDSQHILRGLLEHLYDVPKSFTSDQKSYLIIVCPLTEKNKSDMSRFIDQLRNNIRSALPSYMFTRVNVIPLNFYNIG